MQFYSLGSSKMEISETDFFDIPTMRNDEISYVRHVLAPVSVLALLLRVCTWQGRLSGAASVNAVNMPIATLQPRNRWQTKPIF